MKINSLPPLFRIPPLKIKKGIPQFIERSKDDIRYDRYERYYEIVRKEAYLHLCHHKYYEEMHHPIWRWMDQQLSVIDFCNCIDLGCGVGHWSGRVVNTYNHVTMIGVDLSYQLLRVAHDHWVAGKKKTYDIKENGFHPKESVGKVFSNVHFIQADMVDLPIKPNVGELVISMLSMDRVKEVERAIIGVHRILKPGGHFIIVSPFNFQYEAQWHKYYQVEQFISNFKEAEWSLKCHNQSLPYFAPLDIRNNCVSYNCHGLVFEKKPF